MNENFKRCWSSNLSKKENTLIGSYIACKQRGNKVWMSIVLCLIGGHVLTGTCAGFKRVLSYFYVSPLRVFTFKHE